MSPSDIELLIWCHCRPERHPRAEAEAVKDAFYRFLDCGAIEQRDGDYYVTTEKGRAWISILCDTPAPEQAWVDAHNKVIVY